MQFAVGARVRLHRGEIDELGGHHAGADGAAPARRGLGRRPDAGVGERLLGSDEREAVRPRRVLEQPPVARERIVEALHLGGDAHRIAARVELRDRGAAAAAGEQRAPGRLDIVADRRDEADAGDRDAVRL